MIAGLKRVLLALLTIGAACIAVFFGWHWYDRSRDVQVTDDAYVRGEITNISARVTGYAVEVLVDDNMPVKAAQVVARIDPRDFRMAVEKSQAARDQANAGVTQIGAQRALENSKIQIADAALRSAEAQTRNAELILQRATTLAVNSFATQASVDADIAATAQARSAVDQAGTNVAFEREQLVVIDSNEAVARAQLASAEATLLAAKFALDDTEIWAPIDGVVANRKIHVGEYLTPGTRMLSIVPIDNPWIEANYRENQVGRMRAGDPVRVSLDTYPDKPLCGYVETIAPASGSEFALIPPDNATGNFTKIVRRFTVRIRLNARETKAALVRPGMSVETAVAVSTGASGPERARRIGCSFDPALDIVERPLTRLPEHPGLGRARPQGVTGTQTLPGSAR